jgi:hypothetical protein
LTAYRSTPGVHALHDVLHATVAPVRHEIVAVQQPDL